MPKFNVADKPTLDELYERMLHKGQYVGAEVGVNIEYILPYYFYNGSAVVWNDEIHILGGDYNTAPDMSRRSHYKWDGLKWTSVSTIPFDFYHGSAIVFNDEIHILGGGGSTQYHYKWNGTNWVYVSKLPIAFTRGEVIVYNGQLRMCGTASSSNYYAYSYIFNEQTATWNRTTNMPFNFYDTSLVEYDGMLYAIGGTGSNTAFRRCTGLRWETIKDSAAKDIVIPFAFVNGRALTYKGKIHLLGSSSAAAAYLYHYVWDGTAWTRLADLPYNFYNGDAVIYRDKIHILGSSDTTSVQKYKYHYQYNEETDTWTNNSGDYSTILPSLFYNSDAVVWNNEIHLCGGDDIALMYKGHYKFDGKNWMSVSTLPFKFSKGSIVVWNNKIHLLGGEYHNGAGFNHYSFDGTSWIKESMLPHSFIDGSAIVWNNEIHILGGRDSGYEKKHYKYDGNGNWIELSVALPYEFYHGSAIVFNNEIHILGSEHSSHYKKHYKFNGATWASVSTLPYNFYGGSVSILNDEINMFGGYTAANNATPSANHYRYDNVAKAWKLIALLPYAFGDGIAITYKNSIHSLSSIEPTESYPYADYAHYKFFGAAWTNYVATSKYKEYFLPEGCLIQCNPENTNIIGNVIYDEELQLYIVKSTGKIQIEVLNDEGYLYNIL